MPGLIDPFDVLHLEKEIVGSGFKESQLYETNYPVGPSSYPRVRSRATEAQRKYVETIRVGGSAFPTTYAANVPFTAQVTKDESHPYFHRNLRDLRLYENLTGHRLGTQADLGGRFQTTKYSCTDASLPVSLDRGSPANGGSYEGRLHAYAWSTSPFPSVDPISLVDLHAYGNKARDLVNPTNPVVDFGQDIGELRSIHGAPSVPLASTWKDRASLFKHLKEPPKKGSDEYLNLQFGWDPLVKDIRAAVVASHKTLQLLKQYERNRGRVVRRRFNFPDIHSYTKTDMGSVTPSPSISSGFYDSYFGKLTKETEFTQSTWFSGAFTYYVTPGLSASKVAAYESAMNHLLGTRLTPRLLWELAPWSWLSDWFVDTGSLINNLQSQILDGSVMWYGYVMAKQTKTDTYSLSGYKLKFPHVSPTLSQSFTAEIKQRVRATPFGFGSSPNSFTMKQWSILAALGISRV